MEHLDWHGFFADHIKPKYELYSLMTERISNAIQMGSSECILFDTDRAPYMVIVDRTEFVDILNHCMTYFIQNEDYEMCGIIKEVINSKEIMYV